MGFKSFYLHALIAACAVGTAGADLTSQDWQSAGDGLLTADSDTGLLWLDWSHTASRSYNNVSSNLGSGGEFEGFRYATEDEIRTLYANAGAVTIAPIDGYDLANAPALELLRSLVGSTFGSGAEAIYNLPGSSAENPSATPDYGGNGPYHMGTAFNVQSGQIAVRWINFDDSHAESWMGHALVMIPAPGTITLALASGLISMRRRR